jgi:hypothetical protein
MGKKQFLASWVGKAYQMRPTGLKSGFMAMW